VGLTRVPDNVPLEQAAILADAVSTPFGADIKPEVLDRAVEHGADYAFDARDDQLSDKIADVTSGRKLDVAFDAVGLKSTFEQALDSVRVGGRMVSVGMSAESPSIGPTSMFGLTQKQVLGHLGYQNVDIETVATLVSRGRLDLSRSISDVVSLEDVRVGIEKLERQDGNPLRILVKP
jgi:threonine dehydrogenase-like Zn-dependent dehydrogenase